MPNSWVAGSPPGSSRKGPVHTTSPKCPYLYSYSQIMSQFLTSGMRLPNRPLGACWSCRLYGTRSSVCKTRFPILLLDLRP